jgi:hypothetical protein
MSGILPGSRVTALRSYFAGLFTDCRDPVGGRIRGSGTRRGLWRAGWPVGIADAQTPGPATSNRTKLLATRLELATGEDDAVAEPVVELTHKVGV